MDNITKTAALRALLLLVVTESAAVFLYFGTNNPEIFPFIAALAVAGVLASVWIFTFVRAPETTRTKWLPLICLLGAIASVLGFCCKIVLLFIGASEGKLEWASAFEFASSIYLIVYFWSRRQATLKNNSSASS